MTKIQDIRDYDNPIRKLPVLFESDDAKLRELLIGRRVVEARINRNDEYSEGTLTLDNGVQLLVEGNEGGCACSAGDYYLENVAAFDHAITNVEVIAPLDDKYGDRSGVYKLFVYAEGIPVGQSIADFAGDDGSGYYGTGFHVYVKEIAA